MRTLLRVLGPLLATLVLATACGTAAADAPPAKVADQLKFTATTVEGRPFDGASLAGKAVVLWFWTPWCDTCQEEAAGVAKAAAAHRGGVTFVGVGAEDKAPAMKDFVTRYGTGAFTNLADTDGAVWRRFGITEQPGYAFISPQGTVSMVTIPLEDAELAGQVDRLVRTP